MVGSRYMVCKYLLLIHFIFQLYFTSIGLQPRLAVSTGCPPASSRSIFYQLQGQGRKDVFKPTTHKTSQDWVLWACLGSCAYPETIALARGMGWPTWAPEAGVPSERQEVQAASSEWCGLKVEGVPRQLRALWSEKGTGCRAGKPHGCPPLPFITSLALVFVFHSLWLWKVSHRRWTSEAAWV